MTQAIGERMVQIETEMKNVAKSLHDYQCNNREDHQIIFTKMDVFIESADKKYVTKTTLMVVMAVLTLLMGILGLVWGVN